MFKRAQRAPESTHDPAAAQVSKGKSLKQSPLQGRTCEATRLSVKCPLSGVPLPPDQTNDSSNFDRFDVSIKFKVLFGIIFNKKEKTSTAGELHFLALECNVLDENQTLSVQRRGSGTFFSGWIRNVPGIRSKWLLFSECRRLKDTRVLS